MNVDYSQAMLYGMYILLIAASIAGAALKVYNPDIAAYVFLSVLGHFFGVLTPAPTKVLPDVPQKR